MFDALLSGRVRGVPSVRTSNTGKPFAIWRMAAHDRNGVSVLCSCISFSTTVIDAVQRLSDGEGIAVTGEACMNEWGGKDGTTRHGLDVLVHGTLTAYHLGRKRKGSEPKGGDDEGGPL